MSRMTAGIWRLQDRCEDLVIEDADGKELAEVYQHDDGMANARLMVAAPDLLTALQNLVIASKEASEDAQSDFGYSLLIDEQIEKAETAIARATEDYEPAR